MPESQDQNKAQNRLERLGNLTKQAIQQGDVLYRLIQQTERSAQFAQLLSVLSTEALTAIVFSGTGIILTLSILSSIKGILLAPLSGLTTGAIGLLIGRYLPKTKDEQLDMLESRIQQAKKIGDAQLSELLDEKYRETLGLPPKTKDDGKYLPPGE